MKLTTRGRYAVTAMLDLAIYGNNNPVSLVDIAERQQISRAYLEQLFAKLKKSGLVQSTRGPGGGYSICASAREVTISAVIDAVDESVNVTSCGGMKNCQNRGRCMTHDLWASLSEHIDEFLRNVSLDDLLKKPIHQT